MNTITEKTVREIALENPAGIRVFESFGIDYCCGGRRSLNEACLKANIDVDQLLKLLEDARRTAEPDLSTEWNHRKLNQLTKYVIENHHAYVRRELPRIGALLTKVAGKHGAAHPELARVEELFLALGQELTTHMLKEEQILFPYIERMEQSVDSGNGIPPAFFGTVKRPIASMIADHDDAGALLRELRGLTNDYTAPDGACPSFIGLYRGLEDFERDLHHHVHLENNILFPRAVEMEAAH